MVLGSISGGRIFAETAVTVARMELPMESEGRAGQRERERETERGGECVAEKITQADTKKNELASAENVPAKGKAISAERFTRKASALYSVSLSDGAPTPVKCARCGNDLHECSSPMCTLRQNGHGGSGESTHV